MCRVRYIISLLAHRAPVRSVTAPAATRSLKKSFSALTSCTTWMIIKSVINKSERWAKNVRHRLAINLNLLEPSLRPCVWPRSSEASPLGAAYRTRTLPGSPGRTAAKPSPPHWHLVLVASIRGEKRLCDVFLQPARAPTAQQCSAL